MWPFGERLKDQDALEKYRRWLRRWLLDDNGGAQKKTAPGKPLATGGMFFTICLYCFNKIILFEF